MDESELLGFAIAFEHERQQEPIDFPSSGVIPRP
jgi:hypothetical protein